MTVEAYDDGVPQQTAMVYIIVNVRKNQYTPEFVGEPYSFNISENVSPGSVLFTGKARSPNE